MVELAQIPVKAFNCPSRRAAKVYPIANPTKCVNMNVTITECAKCDYAANVGTNWGNGSYFPLPGPTWAEVKYGVDWQSSSYIYSASSYNGVCHQLSQVKLREITDGTSHTYLFGEKYIKQSCYENGEDGGDDLTPYNGADFDTLRWADSLGVLDSQDLSDIGGEGDDMRYFGSAHSGGWNAAFCDGSVRTIGYDIALEVQQANGDRADGIAN